MDLDKKKSTTTTAIIDLQWAQCSRRRDLQEQKKS